MKLYYKALAGLAVLTSSFSFTNLIKDDEKANKELAYEAKETNDELTTEYEASKTMEDIISEQYAMFAENNETVPSKAAFMNAMAGFYKLMEEGKVEKNLITVIDFTLPSSEKRMWIMDLDTNKVLIHDLVAHGRNTGSLMATEFSNINSSFQSSLGFYVTGETYQGRNGYSLRIDGMEEGFNDNARSRAVVIHGADYATQSFVDSTGRLGRSYGCPAVPTEITNEVIDTIKGKSVVFIYHTNADYAANSELIKMA